MRCSRLTLIFAVTIALVAGVSPSSWAQAIIEPGETHVFGDAFTGCEPPVGNGITSQGLCELVADSKVLHLGSVLSVSIAEDISIKGFVTHPFTVTGTTPTILDASVSASLSWNGRLFAAGVLGSSSAVSMRLVLLDATTNAIAGSVTLHSAECEGNLTTACQHNDSGNTSGGFSAKVTRGHSYQLYLEAQCSSSAGLVGTNANCLYLPNAILSFFGPANGQIRLDEASISIQPDLFGLISELDDKIDALQESVDQLRSIVEGNSEKLDEVIRLLHTPQGRRTSDQDACSGGPCDFPERRPR